MAEKMSLETLPEELVTSILSFLDCDSLAKTAEVCKWMYCLCNDEQMWREHCKAAWITQQMRGTRLWSQSIPTILGGPLSFNAAGELEGVTTTAGASAAAAAAAVTGIDGMAASKWKTVFGMEWLDRRRCVVDDSDMQGAWHIRFKQVAGGYTGQPYQSSTFAVDGSGAGAVRTMITESYPPFPWHIETKPSLRGGVLASSIQIHNFPAHVITRAHDTSAFFLENDYVYIWTSDPALCAAAEHWKRAGNDHFSAARYAKAADAYKAGLLRVGGAVTRCSMLQLSDGARSFAESRHCQPSEYGARVHYSGITGDDMTVPWGTLSPAAITVRATLLSNLSLSYQRHATELVLADDGQVAVTPNRHSLRRLRRLAQYYHDMELLCKEVVRLGGLFSVQEAEQRGQQQALKEEGDALRRLAKKCVARLELAKHGSGQIADRLSAVFS